MPELDLSFWHTPLREWTALEVVGVMLYPDNLQWRRDYLFASATLWLETHDLTSKMFPYYTDLLGRLTATPLCVNGNELRRRAIHASSRGLIAGAILFNMYILSTLGHQGSVSKVVYFLSQVLRREQGSLSGPLNRKDVYKIWAIYKPVAHLWANALAWASKDGFRSRLYGLPDWLMYAFQGDDEALPTFLAGSEIIRQFGETSIPHAQKTPLLHPDETWKIPPTFSLPEVTIQVKPVSEDMMGALTRYKVPRRV